MAVNTQPYLGVASKWPVLVTEQGNTARTTGPQSVSQALFHRLATPKGSVYFDRDYGSLLHRLPFMGLNSQLVSLIKVAVKECVENEGRVDYIGTTVEATDEQNLIHIVISYRNRPANRVESLIFPYYLQN